jgi:hypothetical protein
MCRLQLSHQINAHPNKVLNKIILNPFQNEEFITAGSDGKIVYWSLNTFQKVRQIKVSMHSVMSLCPFQGGFLLGLTTGELLIVNKSFQIVNTIALHKDCISDILQD